jgi:hypothetical protein
MTSVEHRLPRIAADLTDEQLLIARAVRSFATARLGPRSATVTARIRSTSWTAWPSLASWR